MQTAHQLGSNGCHDQKAKAKAAASTLLALVLCFLFHMNMAELNAIHHLMVYARHLHNGDNARLKVAHYNIYLPNN